MPLRVTVELIPRGDETAKRKICVLDIENDGTGTHRHGNYIVRAEGQTVGGWDLWDPYPKEMKGIRRDQGHEMIAAEAMKLLLEESSPEDNTEGGEG